MRLKHIEITNSKKEQNYLDKKHILMARKIILTFLGLIGFWVSCLSQKTTDSTEIAKHTVLIEIFGSSGSSLSIQYDRILKQTYHSFYNLNCGVGYFPPPEKDANPNYGVAISLNRTSGIMKNHLEIGVGLTYSKGIIQERDTPYVSKNTFQSLEAIYSTIRIGYKYQKPTGGLFFRVGFTPMIMIYRLSDRKISGENFIPSAGIGLGYTFRPHLS